MIRFSTHRPSDAPASHTQSPLCVYPGFSAAMSALLLLLLLPTLAHDQGRVLSRAARQGGASTACLPALNYKHPASVPEPYFVSILPRIVTSFAFPKSPAQKASFHDTTAIKQPKHRSIIHLAKALTPQHRQTYRRERPLPASSSIYPSQYPAYRRNDGVLLLLARLSPRPRVQPPLPKHLGPG